MTYYTVYQITNLINNKKYVGFHAVKDLSEILYKVSENGSIYKDGYMGSGKLVREALIKYGPINLYQELLLITEDKEEAEALEKDIVNKDWVDSDDTYNLSLGGGVTILFGENNGYYGKKHSKETIEKIQEARNKAYENEPFSWCQSYLVDNPEVTFINHNEIKDYFNISNVKEIHKLVYEGILAFNSEYIQNAAIKRHKQRLKFIESAPERLERKRKITSERFKGVPKTEESNLKRGKSISSWIKNNPEKHKERMEKINKNPEKIAKSAEKHRGMKRSEQTKKNISESLKGMAPPNKGKISIVNHELKQRKLIDPKEPIPDGWERGMKFR